MPPISRRTFLAGTAGAGILAAGATAGRSAVEHLVGHHPAASAKAAVVAPPAAGHGPLVLITLYGGNDGLNTVIPYADVAYEHGRPQLGYSATDVLRLDATVGLHPALTGLKALWDANQLAVVQGVGYPNPNRSHFRSMDIWQSAVPERDEPTGWLGRWLDTQAHDPMRALSLGATLPRVLQGTREAAASIPSGQLSLPGGASSAPVFQALERSYPGEADLAAFVARSGSDLLTVLRDVATILTTQPASVAPAANLEPAATSAPTPGSSPRSGAPGTSGGALGAQLDVVSRLIRGGAPTQVYSVSLGGFDTHAAEKATHDRLMAEVDAAIHGFLTGLAGHRAAGGVVVVAYSEFGRRVAENASGGTDHGTAAPVFVAGPGVRGGLYGEYPSLTDLDQGDLRWSTDFRSVYATLADKVLGADPKTVLNGVAPAPVPFL